MKRLYDIAMQIKMVNFLFLSKKNKQSSKTTDHHYEYIVNKIQSYTNSKKILILEWEI